MIASRPAPWRSTGALLLIALPIAALLGFVVALGSLPLTLLMAGAVAGLVFLAVPTQAVLAVLALLTYVVVGLGMYYLKLDKLAWVPYALAGLLWLKLPIDLLLGSRAYARPMQRVRLPGFVLALYAVLFLAALSSTFNETPLLTFVVGGRYYYFFWSVTFVVALSPAISDRFLRGMWLFMLAVVVLQAPFAALQHFMAYGAGKSWDAVVGTFGGDPDGGGASGDLVIFLCMMLGVGVSLGKDRQIGRAATCAIIAGVFITVLMAEVKFFFVGAPVVLAAVLGRDVLRRPVFVLATVAAGMVLVVGTMLYYQRTYYESSVTTKSAATSTDALSDYVEYMFSADTKLSSEYNHRTGEVSRLAAPMIWAREAGFGGPQGYPLGYGVAASRTGPLIGVGAAQKHFPFSLRTSAVSDLLWDTGFLGCASFVLMLVLLGTAAARLALHEVVPPFERAVFGGCIGIVALALGCLLYSDSLIGAAVLQLTLAWMAGFTWRWHRRVGAPST